MSSPAHTADDTPALQPLVHDAHVVFAAPTQVWSDAAGNIGGEPVTGIYHSDTRVFDTVQLTVDGIRPEPIALREDDSDEASVVCLLRHLDGTGADPRIRLERRRRVHSGRIAETVTIASARAVEVTTAVEVVLRGELATLAAVKSGQAETEAPPVRCAGPGTAATWDGAGMHVAVDAPGATLTADGPTLTLRWEVRVPAHGRTQVGWSARMDDDAAVVDAPGQAPALTASVHTGDIRLQRWVEASLRDLHRLRLVTRRAPGEVFLAAGAPWFFTLFGRDAIWAARFLLPLDSELAASTLRVLAAFQGMKVDPATAEQPGKIMHELRPAELAIPGEGVTLPPLYYGTIDATCLWVCLLHDAWRWGMPAAEVEALLPHLESALGWMREYGDADGDGFLEYIDETGTGLANQGWKDSGDSVQWHDGHLAEAPIALCEVQGYAYEAAMGAAELLDAFARPGADEWRAWAGALKAAFAQRFWVREPADGGVPYPAIALDRDKRAVDSLTSNIGHLLGTGILDADDVERVLMRLTDPTMDSGFGLRTMSTADAGYWPLSYHGGSVWTHDTAITITGMAREGRGDAATPLIHGLLAAAEGFGYRMPELHSGDGRGPGPAPTGAVPYPAACRPQAWSAAGAIAVMTAVLGLRPGDGEPVAAPVRPSPVGDIRIEGVRVGSTSFDVSVDNAGMSIRRSAHDRTA